MPRSQDDPTKTPYDDPTDPRTPRGTQTRPPGYVVPGTTLDTKTGTITDPSGGQSPAGGPHGWGGTPYPQNPVPPPSPSSGGPPAGQGAPGGVFGGPGANQGLYNGIFQGLPGAPSTDIPIPQPDAYEQALRASIMQAIQEGQSPVTENDPLMAPIISAMRGQAQRAMDQNRQAVGERDFAQGIPVSSGAYDAQTQGFNQLTNEGTQGQVANVMVNQLSDRRNRLMTALNIGQQYLNAQQSRVLQAELANVNNALASYGLRSNISLGILQQLLGNTRFYDQLGTGANQFAQNQNNNSVTF